MLPKPHVIYGAIFSAAVYFIFHISLFNTILIFLASFLIDFDHYMWYVNKKKDSSLKNAYYYLKNLKKKKKTLMIFHTIEFLILVSILSFFWKGFLFILIGMLFHSLLDVIDMYLKKELKLREFFFVKYLVSDKKNYY